METDDNGRLTFLACELLWGDNVMPPETTTTKNAVRIGDEYDPWLTDENYQTVCNIVCRSVPGATADTWRHSSVGEKISLVQAALDARTVSEQIPHDAVHDVHEHNAGRVFADAVEALLGDDKQQVLEVARSGSGADNKMRSICGIDRRFLNYDYIQWAKLLGVTDAAIRKTQFWKQDRQAAIDAA